MLTALYTRLAMTALSSPRAGAPVTLRRAQSPCALCRGDRAHLVREEHREAGSLAEPLARSLVASEMPSRGEVPRRGKNPREARQAWRAWSLARSSEECCGPWQAGPWYPAFQCADSSPWAHDGHAEIRGWRRSVGGPTMPAWAVTRGAQRLRPRPRSPRLQRATRWGLPRPGQLAIKPGRDDVARHSPVTSPHTSPKRLLLPRAYLLQDPPLCCDHGAPETSRSQEGQSSDAGWQVRGGVAGC